MSNGCRLVNFECGCLADFGTEVLTKPVHIIGENHRLLTGARYGNVAEAGAEQVGMDAGVGVNKDTFAGESLGTMACDRIAVVKVAVLGCIEFNLPMVVEPSGDVAVSRNGFDDGEIAVGDSECFVWSRELDAVAD